MEDSKDYFVAYLDVLGFTDMVFAEQSGRINMYQHTLNNDILNLLEQDKYTIIQFIIISDTIVFLIEYNEENKVENLRKLLQAVQEIQVILAKKNIWIRGAVSYGKVWFEKDKNILIGKGYINAFSLEKEAIYPRVIIDPRIILSVSQSANTFKLLYNKENYKGGRTLNLIYSFTPDNQTKLKHGLIEDDALFVCFGSLLVRFIADNYDPKDNQFRILYNNIKNNLYSNQKTYHKYLWLKNYLAQCFFDNQKYNPNSSPSLAGTLNNYCLQLENL